MKDKQLELAILTDRLHGKSIREIAEKYNYSCSAIYKIWDERPERFRQRNFSERSLEILSELRAGTAPKELVKKYGITKQRISQLAKLSGFSSDRGKMYKKYARQLAQDFFVEGLTVRELFRKYPLTDSTVRKILSKYSGIEEIYLQDVSTKRHCSQERLDVVEALKTKSIAEVAKEFNCSRKKIYSTVWHESCYNKKMVNRKKEIEFILLQREIIKQSLLGRGLIDAPN
jgi:Mor family transcriptional regulator